MIDEMISVGISPLAWAQANLPEEMLEAGLIARVPPVEDDEPSVNYYDMPFTHTAFLEVILSATIELAEAVPSRRPTADDPIPDRFALPDASCAGMYELANMLETMHAHDMSPREYVTQLDVSRKFRGLSLFMLCMRYSGKSLSMRHAIRDRKIVLYMMSYFHHMWTSVCYRSASHPRIQVFRRYRILREPIWFTYIRPSLIQGRREFVESLPIIDVNSIAKEDMRCPYCWCKFDEEDEDGRKDTPVHAPCSFGHVFGRSCLLELMLHMEEHMLCPICREEWHM
jgi:hypothetical protein